MKCLEWKKFGSSSSEKEYLTQIYYEVETTDDEVFLQNKFLKSWNDE